MPMEREAVTIRFRADLLVKAQYGSVKHLFLPFASFASFAVRQKN
jgi:hypothetical protein